MADPQFRTCVVCCEEIPGAAKKCPHCYEWQSRCSRLTTSFLGRMITIFVVGLLLVTVFVALQVHMNPWSDSVDFTLVRKCLSVSNIQIVYSVEQRGPMIATIGTVNNDSDVAWQEVTYEVQYFNAAKQLVDTTSDWEYRSVLAPHSEAAIKIRGSAERPKEDYVTARVIITSGKKLQ
jgi:hypothetical protein